MTLNQDQNKKAFYNQLARVLSGIPHIDKLLLIGDLNARIRREWPLVGPPLGHGQTWDWEMQLQW